MNDIEKTYIINGYDIHARYDQRSIDKEFRPLLANLRRLQKEKQRRIVVFLAAPPGVGKTTLSMFLQDLSNDGQGERIQAIGMDGFHHYQSYLCTHTMMRNGKEVSMVSLKGCPQTFNYEKLNQKIMQLTKEDCVMWPQYIRSLHDPLEDQIKVTGNIVLIEGNYLLLKENPWCSLRQYCDYSIFISTKLAYLEERLLRRKMMGGTSKEDAYAFYKQSDAYNAEYILAHSQAAELMWEMDEEGMYYRMKE